MIMVPTVRYLQYGTYGTVPTVRYLRYLLKSFLTHLICAVSFRFLKLKNPEHEVPVTVTGC
jgi:hypothetical protein